VFWTYTRLLYSLSEDGHIDIEKVLQRCETKFSKRIQSVENNISWDEIKKIQKRALTQEHTVLSRKK
jgi:hypothetical protein